MLVAFLLPLFVVVCLPFALASAFHSPKPHDVPLTIEGPSQLVHPIAKALDETAQFSVKESDVAGAASLDVKNRDSMGGITITPSDGPTTPPSMTVYIASAGSKVVVPVVQAAAAEIAKQLHATPTTVELAPLDSKDGLGANLMYLLILSSFGGYLPITVLAQVMPRAPIRIRYLTAGIASLVTPFLVFGLQSIFNGDYGQSFGTIFNLLAVDALYVFVVGSLAILADQLLGGAITFGVMSLIVLLNFPSSGGAIPGPMLPGFWQALHSVWFGAGAAETFRSLVYFAGAGSTRWILQLTAWAAAVPLVVTIVELAKSTFRLRRELHGLRQPLPATEGGGPREFVPGQRVLEAAAHE